MLKNVLQTSCEATQFGAKNCSIIRLIMLQHDGVHACLSAILLNIKIRQLLKSAYKNDVNALLKNNVTCIM
jgi:hypothetical protein